MSQKLYLIGQVDVHTYPGFQLDFLNLESHLFKDLDESGLNSLAHNHSLFFLAVAILVNGIGPVLINEINSRSQLAVAFVAVCPVRGQNTQTETAVLLQFDAQSVMGWQWQWHSLGVNEMMNGFDKLYEILPVILNTIIFTGALGIISD